MGQRRLHFKAGKRIFEKICDEGLCPEDVRVIPGAAGGPKWLVLAGLDRFLFGTWLKESPTPIELIGASAGAWRFAAVSQGDPVAALEKFEHAYIHQRYEGSPTPQEVSVEASKILDAYVTNGTAAEILDSAGRRLHVVTSRSRHLTGSDAKFLMGTGFGAASLLNAISRHTLRFFQERVVFHGSSERDWIGTDSYFNTVGVDLNEQNLRPALLASGSIPFVMARVATPPGAPQGWYRDGGLTDYHLDLPYEVEEGQVVLYPHFLHRLIPGWLDKFVPWRKARKEHLRNLLLVHPSEEFVRSLPMGKIPDRNDFYALAGKDEERFRLWSETTARSKELAEEFAEVVGSSRLSKELEQL